MKGRIRAAGASPVAASVGLAAIPAVVARRFLGAVALPEGLDARDGRVLAGTFVPEAGVLAAVGLPALVVRATTSACVGAGTRDGTRVRLP